MLEIFYLMIIFNVFMSVFGGITLQNGQRLQTHTPGDEFGGAGQFLVGPVSLTTVFIGVLALLGTAYYSTIVSGNAKTPLGVVYTFAGTFQIAYFSCWITFWAPLVSSTPFIGIFYALFTFLVQSIFAIGFIQMTTGGWGLYK